MKLVKYTPLYKFIIRNVNPTHIMVEDGEFYEGTYSILKLDDYPNLVDNIGRIITAYDYSDPDGLVNVSDYILVIKKIDNYNYGYFAIKVPKDPSDEEYKILQEIGYWHE